MPVSYNKKPKTPLFVADKKILINRYLALVKALEKSWGANFVIAYSFKTNYDIAKTKIFKNKGALAEVVSGREYQLAKKLGYKGNQIIFNGPFKTTIELKTAFREKSLVNIDNLTELKRAILLNKNAPIGLRVKTRINGIRGSFNSRFGLSIDSDEAEKAVKLINRSKLKLDGLHIHIGSDMDRLSYYHQAANKLSRFITSQKLKLNYLDFGGGFPGGGLKPFNKILWHPQGIDAYIKVISQSLKQFSSLKLILEPGRYLVDDAVNFITKIIDVKNDGAAQILTADATISMLPLITYRPFNLNHSQSKKQKIDTIIYGSSCREDDILFCGQLPILRSNNIITFTGVGAYNQSMASDFIFDKPAMKIR